jgi:hypothetical protein
MIPPAQSWPNSNLVPTRVSTIHTASPSCWLYRYKSSRPSGVAKYDKRSASKASSAKAFKTSKKYLLGEAEATSTTPCTKAAALSCNPLCTCQYNTSQPCGPMKTSSPPWANCKCIGIIFTEGPYLQARPLLYSALCNALPGLSLIESPKNIPHSCRRGPLYLNCGCAAIRTLPSDSLYPDPLLLLDP